VSGLAAPERAALADTLDEVGPTAPTLCAGWTAADLAAHLVVRDRRPDSAPGAVLPLPALVRWTERVRTTRRDASSFPALVDLVRAGPALARLAPVDDAVNLVELVVHHEDVLRATGGGPSRRLSGAVSDVLWSRVRPLAALQARPGRGRSLVLATPDGRSARIGRGPQVQTVTGEPLELLLWAFGRRGAAAVMTS